MYLEIIKDTDYKERLLPIDDQEVHDINDAKHIFENLKRYQRIVISMVNTDGEIERLILQ